MSTDRTSLVLEIVGQYKDFIKNLNTKNVVDTGIQKNQKDVFTFSGGSYVYDNKSAYRLNLIEPLYQKNQKVRSDIQLLPSFIEDFSPQTRFNLQLNAIGGKPPYTFESASTVNEISEDFTVKVSNNNQVLDTTFKFNITNQPTRFTLLNTGLKDGDEFEEYYFPLIAVGGSGTFSWEIKLGPNWLQIDPNTGVLTGTVPNNSRGVTYVVVISVSDGNRRIERTFDLNIVAFNRQELKWLVPTELPNAQTNLTYSFNLLLNGLVSPVISIDSDIPWLNITTTELIEGDPTTTAIKLRGLPPESITIESVLPPGLELTNNGFLFGTTPNVGLYNFIIRVTDSEGIFTENFYSFRVTDNFSRSTKFITPSILPPAKLNTDYNIQLEATGSVPPYNFQLKEGFTLPAVLSLSSNGEISGRVSPFSEREFVHQPFYLFTIIASDTNGVNREQRFVLPVLPVEEVNIPSEAVVSETQELFKVRVNFLYENLIRRNTNYSEIQFSKGSIIVNVLFNSDNSGDLVVNLELDRSHPINVTESIRSSLGSFKELFEQSISFTNTADLLNKFTEPFTKFLGVIAVQGEK